MNTSTNSYTQKLEKNSISRATSYGVIESVERRHDEVSEELPILESLDVLISTSVQ
jgi:hypothetical protein